MSLRPAASFGTFAVALCLAGAARAADVTNPAEVAGLMVSKSGSDVVLSWDSTTLDAAGQAETLDHYKVYDGTPTSGNGGGSDTVDYSDLTCDVTADLFHGDILLPKQQHDQRRRQ